MAIALRSIRRQLGSSIWRSHEYEYERGRAHIRTRESAKYWNRVVFESNEGRLPLAYKASAALAGSLDAQCETAVLHKAFPRVCGK